MDRAGADRELKIRLYRWALREWDRELGDGFPELTRVTGNSAVKLVELFRTLDSERQSRLARAMAKRFHKEGCTSLGEGLEPEEIALLRWADSHRMATLSPRLPVRHPKESRKVVIAALKQELSFLGKPVRGGGAGEWRYTTPLGAFRVVTFVVALGRFGDCSYAHNVETVGGDPVRRNLSLLSWLGVSSETSWRLQQPEEGTAAAEAIARLCRYFLEIAPSLLAGLVVDS